MTMTIKIKPMISFYFLQISKGAHKPIVQCEIFQLAIEIYLSVATQSVMKKAS